MRLERRSERCVFAFLPELEPVWGAVSLLSGERVHTLCTDVYGAEQLAAWKRKYNFLFETYAAITEHFRLSILDYLLDIPLEDISAGALRELVLAEPPEEREI